MEEIVCMLLWLWVKFFYKGIYGYVLFIMGSYGKMGVVLLVVCGVLWFGVGLVSLYVFKISYNIV